MTGMTIERAALDQSGSLLSLYDATCDIIRGRFIDNFETKFVLSGKLPKCSLIRGRTAESQNLLEMMEIDDGLRLSIYLKMLSRNGIASVIDYPGTIDKDTRFLCIYYESYTESCADIFNDPPIKFSSKASATHIITNISWGIVAIVVIQLPSRHENKFEILLNKIYEPLISDKRLEEMDSNEAELCEQIISATVYSNIHELTKLTRLEDIYHKLKKLKKNRNEHQRLKYTLCPIGTLYPKLDYDKYRFNQIKTNIIEPLEIYLLQQFNELKRLDFRLNHDLPKLLQGQLEEQLRDANKKLLKINKLYEEELEQIRELVVNIRKNVNVSNGIMKLQEFYDPGTTEDRTQEIIYILDSLELKGKLIQKLQSEGFDYCNVVKLGIQEIFNDQLIKAIFRANYTHHVIICTNDKLRNNKDDWNKKNDKIIEEQKNNPDLKLVYADFTYSTYKLKKIIILTREENTQKNEELNSTLSETHEIRETSLLQSPSSDEYINILLLGESGVGKSTFVNAFANYLHFHTLQQARQNQPIVIIPTSFVMTINDDFQERIIRFGEPDTNENHNDVGQSVTQQCKSYVFSLSNKKKLRIIDTPGYGDTRGAEQDDMNMNEIFSFLNNFTYLNGVCLLFKPEVTQLNPYFRSCCSQLFHYFGENLKDNLIFCFTNARSTFFAPGSTRPLLNAFFESFPVKRIPFEKGNTFCFDSESFRYLVAKQASIEFDPSQTTDFEKSWSRSVAESERFRTFLCNLRSYRRNNEWQSVKDAQFQISYMIRPLLETTRNFLRNIILYERNSYVRLIPSHADPYSLICYSCNRKTPEKVGEVWILPDHLHHSPNACDSNKQEPTEYELNYKLVMEPITIPLNDLNGELKLIFKICAELFYFLVINSSTPLDDPFLTGFARMIDEEQFICRTRTSTDLNQTLFSKLNQLKTNYEKYLKKIQLNKNDLTLTNVYDVIKSVNEMPMIKVQLDAIKNYHQNLIEKNQHVIPVDET